MVLRCEAVSAENLRDLPVFRLFPYSCRYCVYWESAGDFDEKVSGDEAERIKLDWLRKVLSEFGGCGLILYQDGDPVAYAEYALPKFFPRVREYASGPPSDDAVFLACLYIPRRELRGLGMGRFLLEAVESDLRARGYKAMETFARKGAESNPAGPLEFYLKHGFSVKHDCDDFPLVRKELK
jgi:GNAT superfamily N-acetyltransferase